MKTLRIFFLICFVWQFSPLSAQKPRFQTVEGVAQVEFPAFKSRLEVEQEAFDKALVNALEKAFGTAIIQGNSTYMKNIQTSEKVETSTVFNMIANTYVKGEVLEVLKKEFTEIEGEMEIGGEKKSVKELRCKVKVKARELTETMTTCKTFPLDCPDKRCYTTEFSIEDPLYLYFSSPSDGYLSVFLDDGQVAQCLLPYMRLPENYKNGVPVTANKEYIFFSPDEKQTYFESKTYTDSYELYTDKLHEQNRLFILFSPTPLEAPFLKAGMNMESLSAFEKDKGYQVPRAMESEKFQDWLIKSRLRKTDLGVKIIDITISK